MELINGKKVAEEILKSLKKQINELAFVPSLAAILVGDDKSSQLYVDLKRKEAEKIGIDFHLYKMESDIDEKIVIETISFLNADTDIDGIIVQLPLPSHINKDKIIATIDKNKDVDGFKKENIKNFVNGDKNAIFPVFPKALITLAKDAVDNFDNKKAVIIGKSDIFVSAAVAMGNRYGLKIEEISCKKLEEKKDIVKHCDIIFVACGVPNIIKKDFLKEGVIIIDGGVTVIDKKAIGDVSKDEVKEKANFLTPVPGGVGPVTIACLLENLIKLATKNRDLTISSDNCCENSCKIGENQ